MVKYLLSSYKDLSKSDCNFTAFENLSGKDKSQMVELMISHDVNFAIKKEGKMSH